MGQGNRGGMISERYPCRRGYREGRTNVWPVRSEGGTLPHPNREREEDWGVEGKERVESKKREHGSKDEKGEIYDCPLSLRCAGVFSYEKIGKK